MVSEFGLWFDSSCQNPLGRERRDCWVSYLMFICWVPHHMATLSSIWTANKTQVAGLCSMGCSKQRALLILGSFLPRAKCRPTVVTRNGHYWNIIPDLWLPLKNRSLSLFPPYSRAVSRRCLPPDLCDECLCKIWRGMEDYCVKERGYSNGLLRLGSEDCGTRPAAPQCDGMVRAHFSVLKKLADAGPQPILAFSPPLFLHPRFGMYPNSYILHFALSGYMVGAPVP